MGSLWGCSRYSVKRLERVLRRQRRPREAKGLCSFSGTSCFSRFLYKDHSASPAPKQSVSLSILGVFGFSYVSASA